MGVTPSSSLRPGGTSSCGPRRALVLGGGGSTGNAWLIGVVAGLLEAGLDVTAADLTVGTSAGSTGAAQLAGARPADLLAAALVAPRPAGAGRTQGPAHPHNPGTPVADHLTTLTAIIGSAADPADMRRRLGAAALELEAASDGAWPTWWRAVVAARLPRPDWPHHRLLITAVRARTGEPVVFDRHCGVDLVDAVAASCSSSRPYPIGDDRYLDGGYRRNENADLAAGYDRVLVLSPFGGRTLHPPAWRMQLAAQLEELRAAGSEVETIVPDADSEHFFGGNSMDPSLRPAAARAGYQRGGPLADRLTEFWR